MIKSFIESGGQKIYPLATIETLPNKRFASGTDAHGDYLACQLGNRRDSLLYGWYVYVSPEDKKLMEDYTWCALCHSKKSGLCIEVRRRENVGRKQHSIMLSREIWERFNRELSPREFVVHTSHKLDFRRSQLSANRSCSSHEGKRGVSWNQNGKYLQVRISVFGQNQYIGAASSLEEGYQMYNDRLGVLKALHPTDERIQAMPFN